MIKSNITFSEKGHIFPIISSVLTYSYYFSDFPVFSQTMPCPLKSESLGVRGKCQHFLNFLKPFQYTAKIRNLWFRPLLVIITSLNIFYCTLLCMYHCKTYLQSIPQRQCIIKNILLIKKWNIEVRCLQKITKEYVRQSQDLVELWLQSVLSPPIQLSSGRNMAPSFICLL